MLVVRNWLRESSNNVNLNKWGMATTHFALKVNIPGMETLSAAPAEFHKQLAFSLNYTVGMAWRSVFLVAAYGFFTFDPATEPVHEAWKGWIYAAAITLGSMPIMSAIIRERTRIRIHIHVAEKQHDLVNLQKWMSYDLAITQILDKGLAYTVAASFHVALAASFPTTPSGYRALHVCALLVCITLACFMASYTKNSFFLLSRTRIAKYNTEEGTTATRRFSQDLIARRESQVSRTVILIDPALVEAVYSAQHNDVKETIANGTAYLNAVTWRWALNSMFGLYDDTSTNLGYLWLMVILSTIVIVPIVFALARVSVLLERKLAQSTGPPSHFLRFRTLMTSMASKTFVAVDVLSFYIALRVSFIVVFGRDKTVNSQEPLSIGLAVLYAVIVLLISTAITLVMNRHTYKKRKIFAMSLPELFNFADKTLSKVLLDALGLVNGLAIHEIFSACFQQLVESTKFGQTHRGLKVLLAIVYAILMTVVAVMLTVKWTSWFRVRSQKHFPLKNFREQKNDEESAKLEERAEFPRGETNPVDESQADDPQKLLVEELTPDAVVSEDQPSEPSKKD